MQPTHNTLSENIRAQSVGLLNKHLAAAIDLQAQMKQAHWNVRGPNFIAIHTLFDKVAGEAEGYADLIAERAGGLGGTAQGTVQVAAERTFLMRYPFGIANEKDHVFAVSGALAAFGESARDAITRRRITAIRKPPICSPRFRAASINSSGSSNPTRLRNERGPVNQTAF